MAGYRVGLTGAVLEYAVKKYKSHRRLSACINLATLDMEYKTTKEEQMTFKSPKQINFDDFDVYTTSISSFFIFFLCWTSQSLGVED